MIIIETGSDAEVEGANSFIDIEYATAYHASRGNGQWPSVPPEEAKEAALIRSFDYLTTLKWKTGVFVLGVPEAVLKAQAECALRELLNPNCLSPDLTRDDFIKKKVIEGAMETTYLDDARASFQKIEALLRPFLWTAKVKQTRTIVRG